jgi:hypothetical protein
MDMPNYYSMFPQPSHTPDISRSGGNYLNFPRQSQHCISHHIPITVVPNANDLSPNDLANALAYLHKIKADLVRGDLILFDSKVRYRNDGVAIFTGTEIIQLYYEIDDYGSLPPDFHVIEDGVSLGYWEYIDDTDNGRGIDHNDIVWFNHTLVRDQCISNIIYTVIEDSKHAVLTSFTFNGQSYRIIYCYADTDSVWDEVNDETYSFKNDSARDAVLRSFEQLFKLNFLFHFETAADYYPTSSNEHTLFVRMD